MMPCRIASLLLLCRVRKTIRPDAVGTVISSIYSRKWLCTTVSSTTSSSASSHSNSTDQTLQPDDSAKVSCSSSGENNCLPSENNSLPKENNSRGEQQPSSSVPKPGKIVMSGIQPTGVMHIGNYFGAVHSWLKLQADDSTEKLYLGIMDLHSLTGQVAPDVLKRNIFDMTACLLACGIDPKRVVLFQQSRIVQHAQLCWVLGTVSTVPQLYHLQQYRDKAQAFPEEEVPYGILAYPILQAADVLLYKATHVPVGQDQTQNLNVVRSVAQRFNNRYKQKYFIQPSVLTTDCPRLKSLQNPAKKMSKSDLEPRSRVEITEPADSIRESFKEAVVETVQQILYEPEKTPGLANLLTIHATLVGQSAAELAAQADADFGHSTTRYKEHVAELLIERFQPVAYAFHRLKSDAAYVLNVVEEGTKTATEQAEKTMKEVSRIVGIC